MTRALRAALLGPLLLLLLAAGPNVAGARPWTADYGWQASSRTGYENWVGQESIPGSGQAPPFYKTFLGDAPATIGRGLAVQPLGGRIYSNGNPLTQVGGPGLTLRWQAPGASRITTARFSNIRYRNQTDGQYMRVRVWGPGGNEVEDFGPDYGESNPATTYSPPTFEGTPAGGGTAAEMWMFTVCGPDEDNPGLYECPTIANSTPTFGRVGSVRLTLDDPDNPVIAVEATPQIDDGWVNKRRTQRLSVTAADQSSGISRIRVQIGAGTSGAGGRTLSDTRVTCDDEHRTSGRNGLVCPPTATATTTDPAASQTVSDRTYVITAWDYAGNQSVVTRTVRRDSQAPTTGQFAGELATVAEDWTNRRDSVPTRVRATDSRSGVAKIELVATRQIGGRRTVLGSVEPGCDNGCRQVDTNLQTNLGLLERDGNYGLSVRVTDRAGNVRTFPGAPGSNKLRIDRRAPEASSKRASYTVRSDGSVRVLFDGGRDRDSGIRLYMFRYQPLPDVGTDAGTAPAQPRFARVRAADTVALTATERRRFRSSRYRAIVFTPEEGIDYRQPGALIALDRARGDRAADDVAGGEYGNALEVISSGTAEEKKALDKLRVREGIDALERFANDPANRLPAIKGVATKPFAEGLKTLGKFVGRASLLGNLVVPLILPDSTGCTQDLRYTRMFGNARRTFEFSQRALAAVRSAAPQGKGLASAQDSVAQARTRNSTLRDQAREDQEKYGDHGCAAPAELAYKVSGVVMDTLIHAKAVLDDVEKQSASRDKLRDCDQPGSQPKTFNDANRRWNLCWKTKRRPGRADVPSNAEAHHVFPRKWEALFGQAGIANIHDPAYLCWMERGQHRRGASAYNRAWDRWLDKQADFHEDEALHPSDRAAVLAHGKALVKQPANQCRLQY
jgi:hypothetical protein